MDAARLIATMDGFAAVLSSTVAVFFSERAEDVRWKPPDGAWSVLEIVCHLGDEEVDDFRRRLETTLRDPKADWPSIDPVGWAVQRNYNQGDLRTALDRFTSERGKSVAWLRGLKNPDWTTTHTHPKFGSMKAGDLLAGWADHDVLHLRQIAKRLHQLTQRDAGQFKTDYAGQW